MTYEDRLNAVKRWYLDNGHTMLDFARDTIEVRKMHNYEWQADAVEHLYREFVALGKIVPETKGERTTNK